MHLLSPHAGESVDRLEESMENTIIAPFWGSLWLF